MDYLSGPTVDFQPVLDIFCLPQLVKERNYVEDLVKSLPGLPATIPVHRNLEQFLQEFGTADRSLPTFALHCAQMWSCHAAHTVSLDMAGLTIAMERRSIMLASASAWYWLMQDCASDILRDASLLQDDSSCLNNSPHWLTQLTRDVFMKLSRRGSDRLVHPSKYFPNPPSSFHATHVARHKNDSSPNAVCGQVITLLRRWLNFPTNTELLAAYFVLHLVDICGGNMDILLLRGVWRPYREIKSAVLNMSGSRWSSLRLSHLKPFVAAFRCLPLANELSLERDVLDQISVAITQCTPHIPSFVNVAPMLKLMPGPYPLTSNNIPATALSGSGSMPVLPETTSTTSFPSSSLPAHVPSSDHHSGLESLVQFIHDLVPLAQGKPPSSAIQLLVSSNMDYYLPFRNLAPTRRMAMSSTGPFHPSNVLSPGAFASCVINRALTFNTSAATDLGNRTWFRTEAEWEAFKVERQFNATDKQSLRYFFNPNAYGTGQYPRNNGMQHVPVYFAQEAEWRQLLEQYGEDPIPFTAFLKWAKQQVPRVDEHTGSARPRSRLPLVGKLTAFLLAGDLSYAGVVQPPSAEEVGRCIHMNGLGSFTGLVKSGLLNNPSASQEEVVAAFTQLIQALRQHIDRETQTLIGLDEIMTEHLLCKFQRVMRDLSISKGKRSIKTR